jgi:hypothetical protein
MLKLIFQLSKFCNKLLPFGLDSWIRSFSSRPMNVIYALRLTCISISISTNYKKLTSMTGHRSLADGYAKEFVSAVLNCAVRNKYDSQ